LIWCAGIAALAVPARAADLSPGAAADLKRAFSAAALSTSEEPAVRAERTRGEPSAGFMLGAALGAWTAARDQLDYDVKNPSAAGPPHQSQGPPDLDAIEEDCRAEKVAFERLESRSRALGLKPAEVVRAAGMEDPGLAEAWRARSGGALPCPAETLSPRD
jgi:hypothetical protein